jgi:hypothetical protein
MESTLIEGIDKSFIPPLLLNILLFVAVVVAISLVWWLLKKTRMLVKTVVTFILVGILFGGVQFNNWQDYRHLENASISISGQVIPVRGIDDIEISGSQAKITYHGTTYTIHDKSVVDALRNYNRFAKK